MQLLDRRTVFKAMGAMLAAGPAGAAANAHLVERGAPGAGMSGAVVILGERDALLVDALFTIPDATRLADAIVASGRTLRTVFVTHEHPDHTLGLGVIAARFPSARLVAHPAVAARVNAVHATMRANFAAQMPGMIADRAVTVAPLEGALTLEGEAIEVIGPLRADTAVVTALWVPQLGVLVANDVLFNGTHMYLAETLDAAAIDGWRASLDRLSRYDARVVIPGHRADDLSDDAAAFAFTRRYLDVWQRLLGRGGNAAALRAAVLEQTGPLPLEFLVDLSVAAARR